MICVGLTFWNVDSYLRSQSIIYHKRNGFFNQKPSLLIPCDVLIGFFYTLYFMKKSQRLQLCKDILQRSDINERLNPIDEKFMIEVFSNHHDIAESEKEILTIGVIKSKRFNNKEFAIRFSDGTTRKEISYIKAINGNISLESKIRQAARRSIANLILNFKISKLKDSFGVCEITNKKLHSDNLAIDHYDLTFQQLVRYFIHSAGIKEIEKNMNGSSFTDNYNSIFIDFHNKNSKLRIIDSELNGILG